MILSGKRCLFFILGIVVWFSILIILVLSLPLYIYRLIVTNILAPLFARDIRHPVSLGSTALSTELRNQEKITPRSTIVGHAIIDSHLDYDQLFMEIQDRWINAKEDGSTKLKFPELQQYPESRMGIMFWKQDKEFNLHNHLKLHTLPEMSTDDESQQFYDHLTEKLINEPYHPRRSPWEMHLIQNYKNSKLDKSNGDENLKKISVLVLRVHHGMADGHAIFSLLTDHLFEAEREIKNNFQKFVKKPSLLDKFIKFSNFPFQAIIEIGRFLAFHFHPKTIYHISDEKKMRYQVYARLPYLATDEIKYIKRKLGVSFASVLNSSFGAAVGKLEQDLLERTGRVNTEGSKYAVFAKPIPLPNHPKKLTNHFGGVAFLVPVCPNMLAFDRLRECERLIQEVRDTSAPIIISLVCRVFSGHLEHVARFLFRNRMTSIFISNFPLIGTKLRRDGKNVLAIDGALGALEGVSGIALFVTSYDGYLQISVTGENGVVSRDDLKQLLDYMKGEINLLHDIAKQIDKDSILLNKDIV